MQFTDFDFSEKVLEGIRNTSFTECMPVQKEVYHHAMEEGKDVTVQSQTGSGKTAAFLLTIFEKFVREPDAGHRALIVAPTRELAVQIEQEAQLLGGHLPISVGCFHGGVSYSPQEKKLRDGVDIVIGTPGRLLDFAGSKKLIMRNIDMVVIDEADRLFDMGFYPDIRRMLKMMKGPTERQTMLFSATISQRVGHLSWEFMNGPEPIVINPEQITVDEITQEVYHVSSSEKMKLLLGLLQKEQPENALIFTNTKDMAVKLAKRLSINGYNAKYIMGDLPQKKRQAIIKQIKEGDLDILVATDVAARGLHINDLDLVFNYDIPEDPESYVHRIGRTARAGKSGKAITLACEKYVYGLEAIEKFIDMKIPVEWAEEELYQSEDDSAGMRVTGNRDGGGKNRDRDNRQGRGSGSRGSRDSRGSRSKSDNRGGRSQGSGRSGDRSESQRRSRSEADGNGQHAPRGASGGGDSGGKKKRQPEKGNRQKKQSDNGNQPQKRSAATKSAREDSPSKHDDLESRLAYYREKYGEDFQLTESGSAGANASGGSASSGKGRNKGNNGGSSGKKRHSQPAEEGKPAAQTSTGRDSGKERSAETGRSEEKKGSPEKKGILSRLLGK